MCTIVSNYERAVTWWRTNIVFKFPMGFMKDESGGTAMEYALIASLISIVIVGAVTNIGTTLNGFFQTVATAL